MNTFFAIVTILAFSIFVRQILRHTISKSGRLYSFFKKHVSAITILITICILCIPIIIWIIFGGAFEFGEITKTFLLSLLLSVTAAIVFEFTEDYLSREIFKEKESLNIDTLESTQWQTEEPASFEARVDMDTVEHFFGLTSASEISFEAICRLDNPAELELLELEIDSLDPASTGEERYDSRFDYEPRRI